MLNAWQCIGPGTAERAQEACSSCLAVVLHEPGSSGRLLAAAYSPALLRDQGRCRLHALDSMRPATRAGWTTDMRTLAREHRGSSVDVTDHRGGMEDEEAGRTCFHARLGQDSAILAWQQGDERVLRAAVERCRTCKGRCAASRTSRNMACVMSISSSPCLSSSCSSDLDWESPRRPPTSVS